MFIAKDFHQYKNRFVSQLKNMLSDDELGAFILVLANSRQDESLKVELEDSLENTFSALKHNFSSISQNATQDDVDVFKKLQDVDLNEIPCWRHKTIGHWEVSYNAMRQLRPTRVSSQVLSSTRQDFDETRFHFNKPFLKPEILWEGEYLHNRLRVLYNKFPFSDYHLIIALSPQDKCSQLLTKESHQLISVLVQRVGEIFPGFGAGFNSLAAGASVNHLHFQAFIRDRLFAIEEGVWKHNGGEEEYPLAVKRFTDAETSWQYISELLDEDCAFNCLYRQNSYHVIPRIYQGTVELPDWLTGAGWIDVAGAITVSDEETVNSIDEQSVKNALERLRKY